MIEEFGYEVAGRRFGGLVATPTEAGRRAGVLVCHGGAGLGDHDRRQLARLVELGYVAFAPDLFGETFTDRAHGIAVISALAGDPAALRARVGAAWRALAARDDVDPARTAAIGHCFGGLAALELARSGADLRAAVSFHGALTTRAPARAGELRARVVVAAGADDPFAPREHRAALEDELTAAGADWQLHVHGGARHGFTVPDLDPAKQPGCAYHEPSDRRSWQAMRALFDEVL